MNAKIRPLNLYRDILCNESFPLAFDNIFILEDGNKFPVMQAPPKRIIFESYCKSIFQGSSSLRSSVN